VPGDLGRVAAFRALCDCLSTIRGGREPRDIVLEPENLSWATFIGLANEYRVSSAVACAMDAGRPESLPKAARTYFEGLAAHYRRRNEAIRDEAVEVAAILNNIGVTPTLMKGGAHLVSDLYPDIAMRHMSDLDILVPETRIKDCLAKLADHGITCLGTYSHLRSHHYPAVGSRSLPLPIEMHHEVLACPHGAFLTSDEMIASAVELEMSNGVRLAVPSPIHAIMHNIAHAQLNDHNYIYGSVSLKCMLDFSLLSQAHYDKFDWDEISRRFIRSGWRYAWEYHVQWARRLGAEVPCLRSPSRTSQLLFQRALYHTKSPKTLSLNVRLLRPWILLRRELSDSDLRRQLMRKLTKVEWWRRHLGMLFR
jgi:Uncharacterised nucleotidyltransferase